MNESFTFDVFLSHSKKDREAVRALAKRLRADGVRVCPFDWNSEVGLELSRVLILCISTTALDTNWVELENHTFRFRDPRNPDRQFVLVRLNDVLVPGVFRDAPNVDFREPFRESAYASLLVICKTDPEPEILMGPDPVSYVRPLSTDHSGKVRCVAFSADGRRMVSGSDDDTIRLWDLKSGHSLRVLEGHTNVVWGVAFHNDQQIVSASADRTLRLWDIETGRTLRVLLGHSGEVNSVACSTLGQAISGSDDKTLRLWDLETGQTLRILKGHTDMVFGVTFSPDGQRVISASDDRTVRYWDLRTGKSLAVLNGHTSRVWSVAHSPVSNQAISGSNDGTLKCWDLANGRVVKALQEELRTRRSPILNVAYSPDGRLAISGSYGRTIRAWDLETGRSFRELKGHADEVSALAVAPDGRQVISGSTDGSMRLWDLESGRCVQTFLSKPDTVISASFSASRHVAISCSSDQSLTVWGLPTGRIVHRLVGHTSAVRCVVHSANKPLAISGSDDQTIRLWNTKTGNAICALKGHSGVVALALNSTGQSAVAGSNDGTVQLWDLRTRRLLRVLEGHSRRVASVAFSPDNRYVVSGSDDRTIRVWDARTGRLQLVLKGHSAGVSSLAYGPDGKCAISASDDKTLRIWDLEAGRTVSVLEGHSAGVSCVAFSKDGLYAVSGSYDRTIRVWDLRSKKPLRALEGHHSTVCSVDFGTDSGQVLSAANNGVLRIWNWSEAAGGSLEDLQYTNAKVLLVGDSGAGKTGLSVRLAHDRWEASESTVGVWATQVPLPRRVSTEGLDREIWLWDFGGQADQRLIHSLYMEDTALAVLVFDGQKEDLFESLGQWDRDLTRNSGKPFPRILAAGRTDASVLRVSRASVERFAKQRGFSDRLFETSAKHDKDCRELRDAIVNAIDWQKVEWRSSPRIFKLLKDEIVRLKDSGRRILVRLNELRDALQLQLAPQEIEVKTEDVKTVVGLLAGPGIVWELKFGSWVLLRPEMINAYGQAVIQTLREDPHERGLIAEDRVLRGDLRYASSLQRLEGEDERILLLAMVETLLARGLCLREQTDEGAKLIFPSYYRRERPDLIGHPAVLVSYRFSGFLDEIYATLVVRLHHTKNFDHDALWRYAADFKNATGKKLGIKLTRLAEGAGELEAYCDPKLPLEEKIVFSRFVQEHLNANARDVIRLRCYTCPYCHAEVKDREKAMERVVEFTAKPGGKKPTILCVNCERRVQLWDEIEEAFAGPIVRQKTSEMAAQAETALGNAGKERALVGEVISTVALAGQISREFTVADWGIDMEIEFTHNSGEPTGKKLYLQLKSGDSYLKKRKGDAAEVFRIPKARHAEHWSEQAFPVMLVVRNSEGLVRWMEIRDLLRKSGGTAKQIVFEGERFDVMSVRKWRDRELLKQ